MGCRGKLAERQQARQLRRAGLPLAEIAARLGVSKSSVSPWVCDVEFEPRPREGRARIGRLTEREFLVAGVVLYAGEGSKRDGP
jgi:transcriptional regulator with XRE-family HTH domain